MMCRITGQEGHLFPERLGLVVVTLCLVVALASACPKAQAGDDQQDTLLVSISEAGWPPYTIVNGESEIGRGVMLDVMGVILERLGYRYKLVNHPNKRILMLLEQGAIDLTTKSRDWVPAPGLYLWSDAIVYSEDVIVSRSKSPVSFDSLDDLKGVRMGGILGFGYPKLEPLIEQGVISWNYAKTIKSLLQMLVSGRIDAVVANRLVAYWTIHNVDALHLDEFYFSETPLDRSPYQFAFSRGAANERIVRQFNKELKKMHESGEVDAIMNLYTQ